MRSGTRLGFRKPRCGRQFLSFLSNIPGDVDDDHLAVGWADRVPEAEQPRARSPLKTRPELGRPRRTSGSASLSQHIQRLVSKCQGQIASVEKHRQRTVSTTASICTLGSSVSSSTRSFSVVSSCSQHSSLSLHPSPLPGGNEDDAARYRRGMSASCFVPSATPEPALEVVTVPTVYIGPGNNSKLVRDILVGAFGMRLLPESKHYSGEYDIRWGQSREPLEFDRCLRDSFAQDLSKRRCRLLNHIPQSNCITNKSELVATLRNAPAGALRRPGSKAQAPLLELPPYHPLTFLLDRRNECQALAAWDAAARSRGETPLWIIKPSAANRGRGIHLTSDREVLLQACTGSPTFPFASAGVAQHYLQRPLLLRSGRHKFDIRCYALITRLVSDDAALFAHGADMGPPKLDPTVYFREGYCRVSLTPYEPHALDDISIHLTNAAVQKNHSAWKEDPSLAFMSLDDMAIEIVTRRMDAATGSSDDVRSQATDYLAQELFPAMLEIVRDVIFRRALSKFSCMPGCFDLYGLDFILDNDMNLYLLEVNTNPALSFDAPLLEHVITDVVEGALYRVLDDNCNLLSPGKCDYIRGRLDDVDDPAMERVRAASKRFVEVRADP